jgi:hypothetical protein
VPTYKFMDPKSTLHCAQRLETSSATSAMLCSAAVKKGVKKGRTMPHLSIYLYLHQGDAHLGPTSLPSNDNGS